MVGSKLICTASLMILAAGSAGAAEPVRSVLAVSDASTKFSVNGKAFKPAVPAWTHWMWPKIEGATWIWTANKVSPDEAHNGSPIITFTRTFDSPSAQQGRVEITADNAFEATLNGKLIGSHGALDANPIRTLYSVRCRRTTFPCAEGRTFSAFERSTIIVPIRMSRRPIPAVLCSR